MAPRLDLHALLKALLGSENVYFQPPANHEMLYPCIRYERKDIHSQSANNRPYRHTNEYSITVIDENPDSIIPDKVSALPRASFDRNYISDNLNHYVFNILF